MNESLHTQFFIANRILNENFYMKVILAIPFIHSFFMHLKHTIDIFMRCSHFESTTVSIYVRFTASQLIFEIACHIKTGHIVLCHVITVTHNFCLAFPSE